MNTLIQHLGNRTFLSFKVRNFRLLWLGSVSEHTGEWMERVAVGWLVYQITGSAWMLGVNEFLRYLALLVVPFLGGVMADRVDRRRLLMATLIVLALMSVALGVLVQTNRVEVWHILLYSFLSGATMAFNHPARATILAKAVDQSYYTNAFSLDTASVMGSRLLGSPVAGLMVSAYGVGSVMGTRAFGCLLAFFWLTGLRVSSTPSQARRESMWQNLKQGLAYAAQDRAILAVTLVSFIPFFFLWPYSTVLPAFAKDVLQAGASGLGYMNGAAGLGSLLGLLWLASLSRYRRKGLLYLFSIVAFGVAVALFAAVPSMIAALVLLVAIGVFSSIFSSLRSILGVVLAPDEYRGRVMSLREVAMGVQPFGNLLLGALAQGWGVAQATIFMGLAASAAALIAALFARQVRQLE